MVTDSDNSKNNNFKNENVMGAPFLKRLKWTLIAAWLLYVLSLNKANAADYYWVGGTGNWSDVSHWATTSGGTTFHTTPPDSTSDVYFDANSLVSADDTIYGSFPSSHCNKFTSLGTFQNFILLANLFVHGALDIDNKISLQYQVNFSSDGPGSFIRTRGNSVSNYQLPIYFLRGTWSFSDSLIMLGANIYISDSCTFYLNGNHIRCDKFVGLNSVTINTGPGTLTIGSELMLSNATILNGVGSKLIISSNTSALYDTTGTGFDEIYVHGSHIGNFTCNKIFVSQGSTIGGSPIKCNYLESYGAYSIGGIMNIGKAVIYNTSRLGGVNTSIDTLVLNAPGDTIFIEDTIYVNNIINMDNPITIMKDTFPNVSSAGIQKQSGQICLYKVLLKDINAIGGAQFFADTSCIDLGGNTGWIWAPCSPSAPGYYWVGGTGNWSDVSHWATTSGGTTFHTVPPGINDDVYFDGNSFTSNSDTVKVIGAFATCNSFNWDVPQLTPVIIGSSIPLTIAGDLNLQSNFDWQVSDLRLTSSNGTILTNGNKLLSVTIDNNSTYQLADDIKCGYLDLLNTNFNSNNRTLTVGNIDCRQSPIEFGTSIINIVNDTNSFGLWSKIGDSTNVSNSTINLYKNGGWLNFNNTKMNAIKEINVFANSSGVNSLITGPFNCGKLIADQIVSITPQLFMGNRSFINKAVFKNNVYLNTGIIIDTLLLDNPGYTTQLTSGDTLFINNAFFSSYSSGLFGLITSALPTYISMNNGIVCLNNISLQNINTIGGAQFFAGNGCVDLGGNTGWQFAPCSIVSDVWPGDANYDLIVNNIDVLNIGLAYNQTGPVRTGASLAYTAQPATDWNSYFTTAVNKKHADTNGDGVVNDDDTTAVSLNYGLTHPARLAGQHSLTSLTDPYLYLDVTPDSTNLSDTVYIDTYYGTAQTPVDSVYGIAFTINYDTALVDTSWISNQFLTSWLGQPGVDLITFAKSIPVDGKIDFALVRNDHTNVTGFGGALTRTGIVIVDNVAGRIPVPFTLSNAYALTASEYVLGINLGNDSTMLDTTATGIQNQFTLEQFRIMPNPASEFIVLSNIPPNATAEIYNTTGQIILQQNITTPKTLLNIKSLKKGIYTLRINGNNKIFIGKLIKM